MLTTKAVIVPTRAPSHHPIAPPKVAPSNVRSLDMGYRGGVGAVPPNGSRLSRGASAGGRKHLALRYELAGAQTFASPESRPRQLQAHVRQHASLKGPRSPTPGRFGGMPRRGSGGNRA